jgi:ArsR family transcriptional regulator, arsenate/arsenite/antimonite-responsive transcriptional repressor
MVFSKMDNFTAITRALSDPNRARALLALWRGELCVCQIIEMLGLAPSTVSKHMSLLKNAGLVTSRKQERWMYYRLPAKKEASWMVQGALNWCFQALESNEVIRRDRAALIKIVKQNPSSLCKLQRSK